MSVHACPLVSYRIVSVSCQARLLNPPVPDHKETIYYMHPTLGRQRWLFARSWMSPQSSTPAPPSGPLPVRSAMPPKSFSSIGGESAFSTSSHSRFSTGGLFGPSTFSSALPDAFKPSAQKNFDEENVSPFGAPFGGRQSMYVPRTDSIMKADWRGGMPY